MGPAVSGRFRRSLIPKQTRCRRSHNAPRTHRPTNIFDVFAGHEIGRELKKMSKWLDEHRTLLGLVAADLRRDGVQETGRQGLPAEAVLRCGLLQQYRQLSYEELAFHLEDIRVCFGRSPGCHGLGARRKSVLHKTTSAFGRDNLGGDQSDASTP